MEGDNRFNDWWAWEQAGRVQEPSGIACDQYHRFESDLDLAKSLGHTAHRFSLEWSRIEPAEDETSEEALAHYADLIRACRRRNLEPIVTLSHFTIPIWLSSQGGWASSRSVTAFARYVRRVADRLGGEIRWWVTINEPTSFVYQGYVKGIWPPGGVNDVFGGIRALKNLIRAHQTAYRILHERAKQRRGDFPKVGLAHHVVWYTPCNPRSWQDRLAAWLRHRAGNRWVLDACRSTMDFIGLNYYTRDFVHWAGWGPLALLGTVCSREHHEKAGPRNQMGWEIYPEGLQRTLLEIRAYRLPILITENGVCTGEDSVRLRFIEEHLRQVREAVSRGVKVLGYLHWSLLDNFEWAEGYAPRFGLVEVDFSTQERRIRPSAWRLAQRMRSDTMKECQD